MTTSTSLTPPYPQGIGATWSVPMDTDALDLRFFLDFPAAIQAAYAVDNTRLFFNGSSMGTAMTNRNAVNTPVSVRPTHLTLNGRPSMRKQFGKFTRPQRRQTSEGILQISLAQSVKTQSIPGSLEVERLQVGLRRPDARQSPPADSVGANSDKRSSRST